MRDAWISLETETEEICCVNCGGVERRGDVGWEQEGSGWSI